MTIRHVSHQGLIRKQNEDRLVVEEFKNGSVLLAVADGMGGHAAGELAAEIAAESVRAFQLNSSGPEAHLIELVYAANRKILEVSAKDLRLQDMGTTLTAAFIKECIAYWVHVGDSRLYVFRDGELAQVTDDQTVIGFLQRAGEIDREEARGHPLKHVLTSCLGRGEFELDSGTLELMRGDLLILSTDGLHDCIEEEEIASILRRNSALKTKVDALLEAALNAGGSDNITTVVMEI